MGKRHAESVSTMLQEGSIPSGSIVLMCDWCKQEFFRAGKEHRRNIKKGRIRTFCSRKCSCDYNWAIGNVKDATTKSRVWTQLRSNNRKDEFSPFRSHLRQAKSHAKKKGLDCTVTLQDLKTQWEGQNGACPYSGWELINPETSTEVSRKTIKRTPFRASLDRIDSSLGYCVDNVQFVSLMAQYAKNSFDEEVLLEFCRQLFIGKGSKTSGRTS